MSSKHRRSVAKGKEGELEAADALRPIFPDVRRRVGEESRGQGLGRDLDGTPGFCFQVKLAKRPPLEEALREAINGARGGEVPVAATRRTGTQSKPGQPGEPWLVTLRLEDFVLLMRAEPFGPAPAPECGAVGTGRRRK